MAFIYIVYMLDGETLLFACECVCLFVSLFVCACVCVSMCVCVCVRMQVTRMNKCERIGWRNGEREREREREIHTYKQIKGIRT